MFYFREIYTFNTFSSNDTKLNVKVFMHNSCIIIVALLLLLTKTISVTKIQKYKTIDENLKETN